MKLRKKLRSSWVLSELDEQEMDKVVDAVRELKGEKGAVLVKEGSPIDAMFLLESGRLHCSKVFRGTTYATFLKAYQPGDGFGELALLYQLPHPTTITCESPDFTAWTLNRR